MLTRKQTHSGRWGALEFGHGAALERLAQLGDALGGVGTDARIIIDTAELIVAQAATGRRSVMGVDTKANAWEPVRGRSAPEVGDVCLFKHGSERNCALVSDVVVPESARGGGSV